MDEIDHVNQARSSGLRVFAGVVVVGAALFGAFFAWITKGTDESGRHGTLLTEQLVLAIAGLIPAAMFARSVLRSDDGKAAMWLIAGLTIYAIWAVLNDAAVHGQLGQSQAPASILLRQWGAGRRAAVAQVNVRPHCPVEAGAECDRRPLVSDRRKVMQRALRRSGELGERDFDRDLAASNQATRRGRAANVRPEPDGDQVVIEDGVVRADHAVRARRRVSASADRPGLSWNRSGVPADESDERGERGRSDMRQLGDHVAAGELTSRSLRDKPAPVPQPVERPHRRRQMRSPRLEIPLPRLHLRSDLRLPLLGLGLAPATQHEDGSHHGQGQRQQKRSPNTHQHRYRIKAAHP